MAWRLEGTYIENCNCDVVCPCGASGFAAPADYERCNAVLAWHIDSGEVDGTDVSDLSVVLVLDSPAQMSEGNWRVGMFMDERASDEQTEKLGAIFSGQMGGPLPKLTETRHPANSELTPARSLSGRVQGLGLDFSGEGKSGFSTPFSWA